MCLMLCLLVVKRECLLPFEMNKKEILVKVNEPVTVKYFANVEKKVIVLLTKLSFKKFAVISWNIIH